MCLEKMATDRPEGQVASTSLSHAAQLLLKCRKASDTDFIALQIAPELERDAENLLSRANEQGPKELWEVYREFAFHLGNVPLLRGHALKVGCWLGRASDDHPCGHPVNATLVDLIPYALTVMNAKISGEFTLHLVGCTREREGRLSLRRLHEVFAYRFPSLTKLRVVMVGFFEDYHCGARVHSSDDTLATCKHEDLISMASDEAHVSLECFAGTYHDLSLPAPDIAVLCNPGLEVHFASWAPTIQRLIRARTQTILVGQCAFQDLSCFDAIVSEPILRWFGAYITVPSTCSPFPLLSMDMRLIALKGHETAGIPFHARDGFFCCFCGSAATIDTRPDLLLSTPASYLHCFVENICRLEMLRDELLEPGESSCAMVVQIDEPPRKAKIRDFFDRYNVQPLEALLPCSEKDWHYLFQQLEVWPADENSGAEERQVVWAELFTRFWERRATLGSHHLKKEGCRLLRSAGEVNGASGVEVSPIYALLREQKV